jgi:Ca-activated chloride channel family protein
MDNWFSLSWFTLETLRGFTWDNRAAFFLLPVIPFLFILRWLLHTRFRQKLEVALPSRHIKWSPVSLLRFLPDILLSISIALIIVCLARPQRNQQRIEQTSEGIDITLILDVSESMLLEDIKPNRLEAAKSVARSFVQGRLHDRIGIVVFSGEAYGLVPLTTDYSLLEEYIDEIKAGMIQTGGTAIGSALAVTINRMKESPSKTKVAILISDGDNTAGNIDPITSAQLAQVYGIKVYTIVVGTEGRLPYKDNSGRVQYVENTIDERILRQIARIGEGKFYRASNNSALEEVFTQINAYEKAKITELRFTDTKDFYQVYLRWAIIFFLLWLFSKSTFINNILED